MYIDTYIATLMVRHFWFLFSCSNIYHHRCIQRKKHGIYTLIISVKNQEEP